MSKANNQLYINYYLYHQEKLEIIGLTKKLITNIAISVFGYNSNGYIH